MAKLSTDELLDAFKEMTLLELSEFVKQFEDTFEVTAAAPVAVAAAGPAAATTAQARSSSTPSRAWRSCSAVNVPATPPVASALAYAAESVQ